MNVVNKNILNVLDYIVKKYVYNFVYIEIMLFIDKNFLISWNVI